MVREAEGCQDSTKGPSEEQCLTWAASVGHGCPRPGLLGCWSPRCTASVGSPCSGQQLQVWATPPAACLLGVASWQPHARPHRGQYFLGACVAWRAEVPWPATCSWGWRCRGWCRCRCRWSPPWRGGLALALEGPGGQTSDHHCGCWTRCWRGCYCWSDWSTGALPGGREKRVIPRCQGRANFPSLGPPSDECDLWSQTSGNYGSPIYWPGDLGQGPQYPRL